MSTANEKQIGGSHYKGVEYQHWDFVGDLGMTYLAGCATKYVSRCRKKNGAEDLEKAIHYLEKLIERRAGAAIRAPTAFWERGDSATTYIQRFCLQLEGPEANIVTAICYGHYEVAILGIREFLSRSS